MGRINITVPADVHTALRVYCVQHGKTMAEVVVAALTRFLADDPREPTKKKSAPV